jgi:hypothetical protein
MQNLKKENKIDKQTRERERKIFLGRKLIKNKVLKLSKKCTNSF